MLSFHARCLFGQLALAMAISVIFQIFKVNINIQLYLANFFKWP